MQKPEGEAFGRKSKAPETGMSLVCFWNNIQTMLLEQDSQEGIEGGEVGEVNRTQITVSDRAGPWAGCR